jgi:intracellular multiplication protein IcmQ
MNIWEKGSVIKKSLQNTLDVLYKLITHKKARANPINGQPGTTDPQSIQKLENLVVPIKQAAETVEKILEPNNKMEKISASPGAAFFKHDKNTISPNEVAVAQQLMSALRQLLAAGDWLSSILLQTFSKEWEKHCQEIQEWLNDNNKAAELSKTSLQSLGTAGKILVYVSLYQTEGNNLQKWTNTLKMLGHYSQTRPIYRQEEHMQVIIRTKAEQQREAYAIVEINENDILPSSVGRTVVDRLDHELLTLKRDAIKSENIIQFVHNGNHYDFVENQLLPKEVEEITENIACAA